MAFSPRKKSKSKPFEDTDNQNDRLSWNLLFTTAAVTIGGSLQFGYATGFVNNTVIYIKDHMMDNGMENDEAHFKWMWSIFVGAFGAGGFIGTFFFVNLCDKIGRKKTIWLTGLFYLCSCPLIAFPFNWYCLFAGRFIVGFGTGGATSVIPMYISEISPKSMRGMLGTSSQLLITWGIFLSQALSTAKFQIFGNDEMWQFMLAIPMGCSLLLLFAMPFCAESPSYLYKTQGRDAAQRSLHFFGRDSAREIDDIAQEIEMSHGEQWTLGDICFCPPLRRAIVVGCIVNLSMQLSGIDGVLYYSTMVFLNADIPLEWAQIGTTLVGLINFCVTIPAMLFMDSAGRKVLQCTGLGGMSVAYVVMTYSMVCGYHYLAVVAMCFVIIFFAFGPGCIAWFIMAEMVPLHARVFATSLGLGLNWLANWAIGFGFPHLLGVFGHYTFLLFMFLAIFFCLSTAFLLPETKGKTMREVTEFFERPGDRLHDDEFGYTSLADADQSGSRVIALGSAEPYNHRIRLSIQNRINEWRKMAHLK